MRALLPLLIACSAPPPRVAAPEPDLDLAEGRWQLVEEASGDGRGELAVRFDDTAHGARIRLDPYDPGVTVVHDGIALDLVHAPFPLTRAKVQAEGLDLVVRLYGPPLSAVFDHPEAPEDPIHTWVRLRQRGDDWRIVLDGLGILSVPTRALDVELADATIELTTDAGAISLSTDAPATDSSWTGRQWRLSTVPSLRAFEPYPRTALTWRPRGLSP